MKQQDFEQLMLGISCSIRAGAKYDQLTADEFRAIHTTIKTLVHNGREERKIYKAGEAADWADLGSRSLSILFKPQRMESWPQLVKERKRLLVDQYYTGVVQMETFLNRLDGYKPKEQLVSICLPWSWDGTAQFDKMEKDYAKKISALPS